uniref:Uncharacterized protein n=1 Tax=viral metagenome TaxID=1070528 RepID=A0A6C0HBM4_9ZZZZ
MEYDTEPHKFILSSKDLIDKMLFNRDYKGAFNMLVKIMGTLDENDRNTFIGYYDNYFFTKCPKETGKPRSKL